MCRYVNVSLINAELIQGGVDRISILSTLYLIIYQFFSYSHARRNNRNAH